MPRRWRGGVRPAVRVGSTASHASTSDWRQRRCDEPGISRGVGTDWRPACKRQYTALGVMPSTWASSATLNNLSIAALRPAYRFPEAPSGTTLPWSRQEEGTVRGGAVSARRASSQARSASQDARPNLRENILKNSGARITAREFLSGAWAEVRRQTHGIAHAPGGTAGCDRTAVR